MRGLHWMPKTLRPSEVKQSWWSEITRKPHGDQVVHLYGCIEKPILSTWEASCSHAMKTMEG
jgi:hypothetical protein